MRASGQIDESEAVMVRCSWPFGAGIDSSSEKGKRGPGVNSAVLPRTLKQPSAIGIDNSDIVTWGSVVGALQCLDWQRRASIMSSAFVFKPAVSVLVSVMATCQESGCGAYECRFR